MHCGCSMLSTFRNDENILGFSFLINSPQFVTILFIKISISLFSSVLGNVLFTNLLWTGILLHFNFTYAHIHRFFKEEKWLANWSIANPKPKPAAAWKVCVSLPHFFLIIARLRVLENLGACIMCYVILFGSPERSYMDFYIVKVQFLFQTYMVIINWADWGMWPLFKSRMMLSIILFFLEGLLCL